MSTLRFPKPIEAHPRKSELEALLASQARPLWEGSTRAISHMDWTEAFEKALWVAKSSKFVERGLEQIEPVLENEKKGLEAARAKQGLAASNRISRLLILANDGAERFYRAAESLLNRHPDRLMALRLDVGSDRMGLRLYGPDKPVKALLVTDRDAVSRVLLSLLEA